jgi:hypothetical protein
MPDSHGVPAWAVAPRTYVRSIDVQSTAPVPLVVNMYSETDFRGMGIACALPLMNTLLKWATAQSYDRVALHASDAGRPLYQSLAFVPTNEMRWSPTDDGVARMKSE